MFAHFLNLLLYQLLLQMEAIEKEIIIFSEDVWSFSLPTRCNKMGYLSQPTGTSHATELSQSLTSHLVDSNPLLIMGGLYLVS